MYIDANKGNYLTRGLNVKGVIDLTLATIKERLNSR